MGRAALGLYCPLVCAGALLASCDRPDWRVKAAEEGQQIIRATLDTSNLRFFDVQVVGDSRTGQICGKLLADGLSARSGLPARFIVYRDGTAGPWIENQYGRHKVSDERFDIAWRNDCVNEGWRGQ
ncbi:MAG: hypothetical protein AB7E05_03965 [Sphingobium sp.]